MRRLFCCVFLLGVTMGLFAVETRIRSEFWNRYTMIMQKMDVKNSYISLARGYFTLEPKFNDNVKGRFTLDFYSALNKDFKEGAGIKLKYAYIDFVKLIPYLNATLSAGLIKHFFGTVYDWKYITIDKSLEDREKIVSSTDYGISINGIIPAGYGEYHISVLNGEGYKRSLTDVNMFPEYCGNIRIIPYPGITIGGSYLYENKAIHPDSTKKIRSAYAGVGRITFGPIDLLGEYLQGKTVDSTSFGYMVMPVINLFKIAKLDMDLVLRYDFWEPKKDTINKDIFKKLIFGFNWNILRDESYKPQLLLQVNAERTFFEDTTKTPTDVVMVQLRWLISNTIK